MKTPPWKLRGSPRPTPGEPRSLIQTEKSGPATPALDPRLYRVSACHGREERELMRKLGVRGLSRRSRGHSERSRDAAAKNSEEKQGMCREQSRGRTVRVPGPTGRHPPKEREHPRPCARVPSRENACPHPEGLSAISSIQAREDISKITGEKQTEHHRRASQIRRMLMSYHICRKGTEMHFPSASRKMCQPGVPYPAHRYKYTYKILYVIKGEPFYTYKD